MSSRESDILVFVQSKLRETPGVLPIARGMSLFGEHAAGWLLFGAAGTAADKRRRRQWAGLFVAALFSHAASVVIKRIVRRKRPFDERIIIGVGTPSKLSFPSSHSTSTTAALVYLCKITRSPLPLLGVPAIMVSRLVLGVHYPSDVFAGALLGAATAQATDIIERRTR